MAGRRDTDTLRLGWPTCCRADRRTRWSGSEVRVCGLKASDGVSAGDLSTVSKHNRTPLEDPRYALDSGSGTESTVPRWSL